MTTLSLYQRAASVMRSRRPTTPTKVSAAPAAPAQPRKPTKFELSIMAHYNMSDDGTEGCPKTLVDILSLNRNAQAPGHQKLLDKYLTDGFIKDHYGNRFKVVPLPNGDAPRIMYTAHTDTVSDDREAMYHPICYNMEKDVLFRKNGEVLGADDGTGIWLMLNMIEAKVPGLYAFYLDEEVGRLGSEWSWKHDPNRYEKIDRIISFDRKGTSDIIATQRGDECCSDEFQAALADLLSDSRLGLDYKGGAAGSFTDSATFMDDKAECTNISVGYDAQHTEKETQLVKHAIKLSGMLCIVGHVFHTKLPVVRDIEEVKRLQAERVSHFGRWNDDWNYGGFYSGCQDSRSTIAETHGIQDDNPSDRMIPALDEGLLLDGTLAEMCEYFPEAIEALLLDMGLDEDSVANYIGSTLFGLGNIRNANTQPTH